MFIFIWNYVEGLTQNYHNGGGCAIISHDLKTAREYAMLFASTPEKRRAYFDSRDGDYDDALKPGGIEENCPIFTKDPDHTYELVGEQEEKLFIFADAGCC